MSFRPSVGLCFPLCASLGLPIVGASSLLCTQCHPPTSMGSRHSCGDTLVPSTFSACTQMPIVWYSCRYLRGMEQWLCPSSDTQSGMVSSWVWQLPRLLPIGQAWVSSKGRKQGSLLPPICTSGSSIPIVLPMPQPRPKRTGLCRDPYSLKALQGEVGGQVSVRSWLPLTGEAVGCEVHEAGQVVGCERRVCA